MLSIVLTTVLVVSAVWVYWDATSHGIGKVPGKRWFNQSAGSWSIVVLLLWIVGFPTYVLKRGELIRRAAEHPVAHRGRTVKLAMLAAAGATVLAANAAVYLAGSLPECGAPEVLSTADRILREAPLFVLTGTKVESLSSPVQKSYDASSETRHCTAILRHSTGQEVLRYSVQWHDRDGQVFFVKLEE